MNAASLLYSQGFGTRRHCIALIEGGFFELNIQHPNTQTQFQIFTDPHADLTEFLTAQPTHFGRQNTGGEIFLEGLAYRVESVMWFYHSLAYIMLNKPSGIECSQKPSHWPSVYTLIPTPLRLRPRKGAPSGVQAVGRLDQDTTGLLLLSDDGQFIHKMSSPKHHVPKIYEVTTEDRLDDGVCKKLMTGVELRDEYTLTRAHRAELTSDYELRLTLTEGKYHQVKRMLGAVGHKVVRLHRSKIGDLIIPSDLGPGQWCWLSKELIQSLFN